MFDPGRYIGLDGSEDISVSQADSQSAAATHGIAAQVNSILIQSVFFDDPLHGIDHSLVGGAGFGLLVLVAAPPPVPFVGAAVQVQGEEIARRMIDVVIADGR